MKRKEMDKRIAKLSFKKFEAEFGFKPKNKREQRWFATKGRRLDPRISRAVERIEELSKRRREDA